MIELKNINLTGITVLEQIDKVQEEEKEFMIAIETGDKEGAISEFYDDIQSKLGLLEKVFGIKADEVMTAYPLHEKKILKRPRRKECRKCINKSNCKLYLTEHWDGEKEAESCRDYKESEA